METQTKTTQQTADARESSTRSTFSQLSSSVINVALANLPIARPMELLGRPMGSEEDFREVGKNWRGIQVTMPDRTQHYVTFRTPKYRIVQHAEAFRPIVDGLELTDADFSYDLHAEPASASLRVYLGDVGTEGVTIGFEATNTHDGSASIKYGMTMNKSKTTIELVGYRQVCSNGMKIRVPIAEAEFTRVETRTKILQLMNYQTSVVHTFSAPERIQLVRSAVEAVLLLREPVKKLIQRSKEIGLDEERLKALLENYSGKRKAKLVEDRYEAEEQNLWGLYNAMTWVASHTDEMKVSARNRLIDRAAEMLTAEVTA